MIPRFYPPLDVALSHLATDPDSDNRQARSEASMPGGIDDQARDHCGDAPGARLEDARLALEGAPAPSVVLEGGRMPTAAPRSGPGHACSACTSCPRSPRPAGAAALRHEP